RMEGLAEFLRYQIELSPYFPLPVSGPTRLAFVVGEAKDPKSQEFKARFFDYVRKSSVEFREFETIELLRSSGWQSEFVFIFSSSSINPTWEWASEGKVSQMEL